MKAWTRVAAGLALAAAADYAAERIAVRRMRGRPDEGPLVPDGWRPAAEASEVRGHDGARLHAIAAGSGPTLVLSHGVMLSTEVWPLVFDPLVERGFRVVAYDQRGHGLSTVGDDGHSVANLGRDLGAVIDAHDARRGLVLGHSMGGLAVLSLLAERPELRTELAGIVLVATTPQTIRMPGLLADAAALTAGGPLLRGAFGSTLHGTALTRVGFGPRASPAALEAARRVLAGTSGPTLAAANRALVGVDFTGLLPELDMPVLVLAGRHDRVVPRNAPQLFATGLPNATMVEVDAGHMLPLEAAGTVVDATVAFAADLGLLS